MPASQMSEVIQQLRRAGLLPDAAHLTDGQLLESFVRHREAAALEALVRRHGPMVWGVCRRVLGDCPDAEDAFQATFLVLLRKAASIRTNPGNWLYGVAHQTALKARASRAKRRLRERSVTQMPEPAVTEKDRWNDIQTLLDQEVSRLPEKYRTVIVLCELEGKTLRDAARQLGCPEGTAASRLARARTMLAKRLARHGLAVSGGTLAAVLAPKAATASVPVPVLSATLKAVTKIAAGQAAATGLVSAQVAALTEGVVRAMLLNKLAKVTAVVLLLAALAAGAALTGPETSRGKPPAKTQPLETKAPGRQGEPVQQPRDRLARQDRYGDKLPEGALARLGTVRFRHDDWVSDVAIAPDGETLAAAAGKAISLWDPATGKRRRLLTVPGTWFRCLAYSPDGRMLAAGGGDNQIYLWDLTSGKVVRRLQGHRPSNAWDGIHRVVFCKGGQRLISSGADGTIRLWDMKTGKEVRQFQGHQGVVSALALSEDGRALAAASNRADEGGEVLVWDVATGNRLRRLPHPHQVWAVALSRDGKTLATGSGEIGKPGEIRLFRVDTGKLIRSWHAHRHWVWAVAFAPDGRSLASGGYEGTVRRWQVPSGRPLGQPFVHRWQVKTIRFSRDGKSLVTSGAGNTLHVWDVAAGKERQVFAGHQNWIASLAFSPDGRVLAAGSGGFGFRLWDLASRRERYRAAWHTGNIVAFGPGGQSVTCASYLGKVLTFRAANGQELRRAKIKGGQVSSVAYAADGRTLAVGGADRRIRIWDLAQVRGPDKTGTGLLKFRSPVPVLSGPLREIRSWQPAHRLIDRLALSPDGKILASAGMDAVIVQLWDVSTGKELRTLKHPGAVECLAFSPDGKTLVAGVIQGRSLHLWETATGRERRVIPVEDFVTSVEFSPDGKWLATASNGTFISVSPDGRPQEDADQSKVAVWSLAAGKIIHRFASPQGGVRAIAFSPDGMRLASGGNDTTILLWDLTRLRQRQPAPPALSARELDALWADLAGADAARAYRAIWALAGAPPQAVALLGNRLRPITAADPKRVGPLLADLDSPRFAVRRRAERELAKLGDSAEPALRTALAGTPSVEVRQRIEQVLRKLGRQRLRYGRALEVLELLGAAEAGPSLKRLAKGASGASLTREAKVSLQRLAREAR
jgi:RNA polymerase sigma factor (sigma-70 family)